MKTKLSVYHKQSIPIRLFLTNISKENMSTILKIHLFIRYSSKWSRQSNNKLLLITIYDMTMYVTNPLQKNSSEKRKKCTRRFKNREKKRQRRRRINLRLSSMDDEEQKKELIANLRFYKNVAQILWECSRIFQVVIMNDIISNY